MRKAGENPLEYLMIKMEDVHRHLGLERRLGRRGRLTENVTAELRQGQGGLHRAGRRRRQAGAKPKMGWDVEANKKL